MQPASTLHHAVHRLVSRVRVPTRRGGPAADLPLVVLRGDEPGPTAVVVANLHGDEVTGVGVVRRLDGWLSARGLRGTVVLVPSANPLGLAAGTRVVPGDDIDLNRAFPGDTRGGWAARAASALWRDISAREPHLLIDLHADAPDAIPYVIVDRPVRRTPGARRLLGDRIASLAEATGLTVLREYPDDVYLQFGLDRSLAGAVVNQLGVPAVTLEVGPRRYQDADAVDLALHATLGALTALGTVDAAAPVHHTRVPGRWRRAAGPRTRRAGLLEPVMRPGQAFARGELLARIKALTGETEEEVRAMEPGLLVSWTESPWLVAGAVVGTVGVADGERL